MTLDDAVGVVFVDDVSPSEVWTKRGELTPSHGNASIMQVGRGTPIHAAIWAFPLSPSPTMSVKRSGVVDRSPT
jgi:hypothetical protein